MIKSESNKHKNYEILNLIGYGLSKFNDDFIKEFGFTTKNSFYHYCVSINVADTIGTVKNRMDLFDHFFPENGRKGWWQKGNTYIHRKELIDNLFGNEDVTGYANIVKLYFQENFDLKDMIVNIKPIIKSRFKRLQETGLEAELFFMNHYNKINLFQDLQLEDARLLGDGYDFQISNHNISYLAEVKGIREKKGKFRLTEKEYNKAIEYKEDYVIIVVKNMKDLPSLVPIQNPTKHLKFQERIVTPKQTLEYHLVGDIC